VANFSALPFPSTKNSSQQTRTWFALHKMNIKTEHLNKIGLFCKYLPCALLSWLPQ